MAMQHGNLPVYHEISQEAIQQRKANEEYFNVVRADNVRLAKELDYMHREQIHARYHLESAERMQKAHATQTGYRGAVRVAEMRKLAMQDDFFQVAPRVDAQERRSAEQAALRGKKRDAQIAAWKEIADSAEDHRYDYVEETYGALRVKTPVKKSGYRRNVLAMPPEEREEYQRRRRRRGSVNSSGANSSQLSELTSLPEVDGEPRRRAADLAGRSVRPALAATT
mmetsp:Transcript_10623/g.32101  ORF Transcript_10623/g.32101 Transcript_10623/m.32101 type:complete len:225 (-) Transcript_10623:248-922(-)